MTDEHQTALLDLVELRIPVATARAALAPWGWDEEEVLDLEPTHLRRILRRFVDGDLSAVETVAWAESVHLRDDIGRIAGSDDLVNEVLLEMSSPELFGDLATNAAYLLAKLDAAAP